MTHPVPGGEQSKGRGVRGMPGLQGCGEAESNAGVQIFQPGSQPGQPGVQPGVQGDALYLGLPLLHRPAHLPPMDLGVSIVVLCPLDSLSMSSSEAGSEIESRYGHISMIFNKQSSASSCFTWCNVSESKQSLLFCLHACAHDEAEVFKVAAAYLGEDQSFQD